MNPPALITDLDRDLRAFLVLCEETFALMGRENRALNSTEAYPPFEFYQGRKNLLGRLDSAIPLLRQWRHAWQRLAAEERERCAGVKALLQVAQDAVVKILMLERENQQALLRRGLCPARHLPSAASQRPGYVAQLYRRHAVA
jgi:hypothetical protein